MPHQPPDITRAMLQRWVESNLPDLLPLSCAEGALLVSIAERRMVDCALPGEPQNPKDAARWSPGRVIRAGFLTWVCGSLHHIVERAEIAVAGVKIAGSADLSAFTLPLSLRLVRSSLPDGLSLAGTEMDGLDLSGTVMGPLRADRALIHGPVRLDGGFRAVGGVRFAKALVLGDMTLSGATLAYPGGVAFAGRGLCVHGNLRLDAGFRAKGAVRLSEALVMGDMDLCGGAIDNIRRVALACDNIQVGGNLCMNRGFRTRGTTVFLDAQVKGRWVAPGSALRDHRHTVSAVPAAR